MTRAGRSSLAALLLAAGVAVAPRFAPDRTDGFQARVRALSIRALGTSVAADPLGEGPGAGPGTSPDSDPRIDLARVDCVTYVEQCLALARDGAARDPVAALDRIRYRGGVVGFATRNHFFVADWIPANAGLVRDVTSGCGVPTVPVRRTIDRGAFLAARGLSPASAPPPEEVEVHAIPREEVPRAAPPGSGPWIAVLVGDRPGIVARHVGFLDRAGAGPLLLRHASSEAGRVIEVPLDDYIASHAWVQGILVLEIRG